MSETKSALEVLIKTVGPSLPDSERQQLVAAIVASGLLSEQAAAAEKEIAIQREIAIRFEGIGSKALYLTSAQVATVLGVNPRKLGQWRAQGTGPQYFQPHGHMVRYPRQAIEEWITSAER